MCNACTYWKKEWAKVQDVRDGAVDPDDFYKEVNYQKSLKKKNKKVKTRPGCPENDFKAHVYVWTTERQAPDFFHDYYGFHKHQSRICCGCGKRNGTKLSDEYMKVKERKWNKLDDVEKGIPIPRHRRTASFRWWSWENEDEKYREARAKYIKQHGWSSYVYGYYGW